eukprot:scaffold4493_cov390-Prasinococcus_capsulatus_cf.AAC.4
MRDHEILVGRAFSAQFGVKVEASRGNAPILNDGVHDESCFPHVGHELISIPSDLGIPGVGIYVAENTENPRGFDFMVATMARKGGLQRAQTGKRGHVRTSSFRVLTCGLPQLFLESILHQEGHCRCSVPIILVFCGLLGLWLNQQSALKADSLLVFSSQPEEYRGMVQLSLHVRVEKSLVAFASTPEDEVLAVELLSNLHGLLHLSSRIHVGVNSGAGSSPAQVLRMLEQLSRAP